MIKILSVGNSFSQDSTALIDFLTDSVFVRNLYYPSCSLEKHCAFFKNDEKPYEYQHNGAKCVAEKVSLKEALQYEKWDYITIQQVSGLSGVEETYYPYIDELIAFIRKFSDAEILFHQTWTYESDSGHPDFVRYDNNKQKMWESIERVSNTVSKVHGLRMIECGKLIYSLGQNDLFNIDKGGISLYRDSFHLSVNYGRFAVACLWIKFFTKDLPDYIKRADLSKEYLTIYEQLKMLD